jgi:putative FmdB family regulatory protein
MPIYDYSCSACGHVTEVIHGINDHGPKFCPECGAEGTMSKGFTAPAVHFKGTGWAKKDRGSSTRAASRAKDEGTSKKESATTESGSTGAASTDSGKGSTESGTSSGANSKAASPASAPD